MTTATYGRAATDGSVQAGVQMITALAERFAVFEREQWKPHWPLKVGIHVDILARAPEIDKKLLSFTLRRYTSRRMYLLAVIAGGNRFDLDGNVAGEIEPSDIECARAQLARLEAATEMAADEHRQRRLGPVVLTGDDIDRWKAKREEQMSVAAWRERKAAVDRAARRAAAEALWSAVTKPVKPAVVPNKPTLRAAVKTMSRAELAERARARRAGGVA